MENVKIIYGNPLVGPGYAIKNGCTVRHTGLYGEKTVGMLQKIVDMLAYHENVFFTGLTGREPNGEIFIAFLHPKTTRWMSDKAGGDWLSYVGNSALSMFRYYKPDDGVPFREYECLAELLRKDAGAPERRGFDSGLVDGLRGEELDPIRTEIETLRRKEIEKINGEYSEAYDKAYSALNVSQAELNVKMESTLSGMSAKYDEAEKEILASNAGEKSKCELIERNQNERAAAESRMLDFFNRRLESDRSRTKKICEKPKRRRDEKIAEINRTFDAVRGEKI